MLVEWLVNDSDSRAPIDGNTDHACYVVEMTFCESFSSIERINPNDHVIFKKFVRELVEVVVGLLRGHSEDLLHLEQVVAVAILLLFVVIQE